MLRLFAEAIFGECKCLTLNTDIIPTGGLRISLSFTSFIESSGSEAKVSLATAHVRKYSVWDGLLVRDSRLAKDNEALPPSVLLLWLAEVQARRLSSDLSVFQPETRPSESTTLI